VTSRCKAEVHGLACMWRFVTNAKATEAIQISPALGRCRKEFILEQRGANAKI
jgi:hypothetical protein